MEKEKNKCNHGPFGSPGRTSCSSWTSHRATLPSFQVTAKCLWALGAASTSGVGGSEREMGDGEEGGRSEDVDTGIARRGFLRGGLDWHDWRRSPILEHANKSKPSTERPKPGTSMRVNASAAAQVLRQRRIAAPMRSERYPAIRRRASIAERRPVLRQNLLCS